MLRIGRHGIVAFPNFGHWSVRWAHLWTGRAPKTDLFPHEWYDSPNIHFLTVFDFESLAHKQHWKIERSMFLAGGRAGEDVSEHDGGSGGVPVFGFAMTFTVETRGKRLDHFLQEQLPQFSRSRLQGWIKEGRVLVDGAPAKSSLLLRGGERDRSLARRSCCRCSAAPEDLPLEILYEDASVIAMNKPAGLSGSCGGRSEFRDLGKSPGASFFSALASRRRSAPWHCASLGQGHQRSSAGSPQ